MRVNKSIFFVFLVFLFGTSKGQGLTASAAYDSATHYRDVADSFWF
jgi:hypothetical protein